MTVDYIPKTEDAPDYVTRGYVLSHCPGLTRSQLNHWIINGWVAVYVRTRRGYKYIYREEYYRLRYMNYLVNVLSIMPSKAAYLAERAAELNVVQKGLTWINYEGTMLGIPIIEEQL